MLSPTKKWEHERAENIGAEARNRAYHADLTASRGDLIGAIEGYEQTAEAFRHAARECREWHFDDNVAAQYDAQSRRYSELAASLKRDANNFIKLKR